MGLNIGIVFPPSLNIVYCWPDLIVVNVVQHCSGPNASKKAYVGKISLAPPMAAHKNQQKFKVIFHILFIVFPKDLGRLPGASVPATFGQKSAKIGCIGVLEPPNGLTLRIFP